MKRKALLFILGSLLLGACMHSKNIEIEGTIRYIGSTPFDYLALTDKEHIFKISNPQDFGLQKLQNRRVKAKVTILKKAAGPGFPTVVKIVSIQKKQ